MFDKKVSEVMTKPVVCLTSNSTVRDAALRMRDEDIGTIVVCESGDKPVGVVTDRDIAVRCAAVGADPSKCRVSEIMSRAIVTIAEDKSLKEAESLLEERQIRRLLAVDAKGAVRGILALSDIVGEDQAMTGRIVEKTSQPSSGIGH